MGQKPSDDAVTYAFREGFPDAGKECHFASFTLS